MPHTTRNSQQAGYIDNSVPTPTPMASTHEQTPDPTHIETLDEGTTKNRHFLMKLRKLRKLSANCSELHKTCQIQAKLQEPDTFDGSNPESSIHSSFSAIEFPRPEEIFEDKQLRSIMPYPI